MNKTINRIWLGGKMPQRFVDYGDEWREMNPAWSLMDWDEEMIFDTKWDNQDVIDQMVKQSKDPNADMVAFYTHVADVVDYEIVYRYGGLYMNTDIKPIRPLHRLNFVDNAIHLAMEDDEHVVNMAMYAEPNNDFLAKVIENLPGRYFNMPGQGMHITTGVGLLMDTLKKYNGPVVKWHRDVWNPIHWSTIAPGTVPDLDRDYPLSTVGSHSWSHKEFMRGHEVLG